MEIVRVRYFDYVHCAHCGACPCYWRKRPKDQPYYYASFGLYPQPVGFVELREPQQPNTTYFCSKECADVYVPWMPPFTHQTVVLHFTEPTLAITMEPTTTPNTTPNEAEL